MAAAAATIDIDASGATTVVALDSRERYSLMHDGDSVSDQLQRHGMKDWVLLSIDEDVLHGDHWKEHDVVHAVPPGHVPSGSAAVAANVALQDISLTVNIEPDFNLLKNSLGKEWTAPQAVKEFAANAIQSHMLLGLKKPPPHIKDIQSKRKKSKNIKARVLIEIDERSKRLRTIDNGHGLKLPGMKEWARLGKSRNKNTLEEMMSNMCKEDKKSVHGLFGFMCSAFGIGGKGGAIILTEGADGIVHGVVTMMSYHGGKKLLSLPLDLRRMQRAKEGDTWKQTIETTGADSAMMKELRKLLPQEEWGDSFTCVQVSKLSDAAMRDLKKNLVADLCATFRYVLCPELFHRLNLGPDSSPPLGVQIDVKLTDVQGKSTIYSLNEMCRSGDTIPAQLTQQRRIVAAGAGGENAVPRFEMPITLKADNGTMAKAHLSLEYFPIKEGVSTKPANVKPGFDVLWTGHLLPNERLRHVAFMKKEGTVNDKFWRTTDGRELNRLLELCGDRVYGELLVPPHLAVTKNKTMLARNAESADVGTQLVEKLYALEIKDRPASGPACNAVTPEDAQRFKQFLKEGRKHDEEIIFVYNDVEQTSAIKADWEGYHTKEIKYRKQSFVAPTSQHGEAQRTAPLRMKVRKDASNGTENVYWAEVVGFRFTSENRLSVQQIKEECETSTDGDVIFFPWTHVRATEPMMMPLLHLEKQVIPDGSWKKHISQAKRIHDEKLPGKIEIVNNIPGAQYNLLTSDKGEISLENAATCKGFDFLCVQVVSKKGAAMSSNELTGYVLVLRAWKPGVNPSSEPEYAVRISHTHFQACKAWLKPWEMRNSGRWLLKLTLEARDDSSGSMGSSRGGGGNGLFRDFSLTVSAAAALDKLNIDPIEEDEVQLGSNVPTLKLSALDIADQPYKLALIPEHHPKVSLSTSTQVQVAQQGTWSVGADGALKLNGLTLVGSLGANKSSLNTSITVMLSSGESAEVPVTLVSGQASKVVLSEPELGADGSLGRFSSDRAPAANVQNRSKLSSFLPAMKLKAYDEWDNPLRQARLTLKCDPANAITHERGPNGSEDNAFSLENGTCHLRNNWMKINRDAVEEADRACKLTFAVQGQADAAPLDVPFTIKGIPKHVTEIALSMRGGAKICSGETAIVELRAFAHEEEVRFNSDHFEVQSLKALTVTRESVSPQSDGDGSACTLETVWQRCEDGLGIWARAKVDAPAGSLSLSVTPAVGGSVRLCSLCRTALDVQVLPGAPAQIQCSASPAAHVENGTQLAMSVELLDSHGAKATLPAAAKVEWVVTPENEDRLVLKQTGRKITASNGDLGFEVLTKVVCVSPHQHESLIVRAKLPDGYADPPPVTLPIHIKPGRAPARLLIGAMALSDGDPDSHVEELDEDEYDGGVVTDYEPCAGDGKLPVLHLTAAGSASPVVGKDSKTARLLAVRVQLENGSLLPPKPCSLKVSLTNGHAADSTDYTCGDDGQELARQLAIRTSEQLNYTGADHPMEAIILDGDVRQPASPGDYSLRFDLTYGNSFDKRQKELLELAGRSKLTEVLPMTVAVGSAERLQPGNAAGGELKYEAGKPIVYAMNEIYELAYLSDADGNRVRPQGNVSVGFTVHPCASGSTDAGDSSPGLRVIEPTVSTLNPETGGLCIQRIELASDDDTPSGLYMLRFALSADSNIEGAIKIRFVNPLQLRRDMEQLQLNKEKLAAKQEEMRQAKKLEDEKAKLVKVKDAELRTAQKAKARAEKETGAAKRRFSELRAMDESTVKRIRTQAALGEEPGELLPPEMQPRDLVARTSAGGKELQEQVLSELLNPPTVKLRSADGQETLELTLDKFIGSPPSYTCDDRDEDGAQVRYELHQIDANSYSVEKFTVRAGHEQNLGRFGDQTLPLHDEEDRILLRTLHGQTLLQCGRYADPRVGDAIVALLGGRDEAVLCPPLGPLSGSSVESVTKAAKLLRARVPDVGVLLPRRLPAAWKVVREGHTAGLLEINGSVHPPSVDGCNASYLVNRICCDSGETGEVQRMAWARALGSIICFETRDEMLRWQMHAAEEDQRAHPELIALGEATDECFETVRGGARLESLPKVDGNQGCKLAGIQSCSDDERQTLAATRKGLEALQWLAAKAEVVDTEESLGHATQRVQKADAEKQVSLSARTQATTTKQAIQKEIETLKRSIDSIGQLPGSDSGAAAMTNMQGNKRQRRT